MCDRRGALWGRPRARAVRGRPWLVLRPVSTVSLSAGYPASAIRERLYCSSGDGAPRAGILLYTGAPGSEGSLGGLVQIGRDVLGHVVDALLSHQLCSNDPVCAAHKPDHALGTHREGAACHGCLFIAEPSCERMNRDLDRALVVPVVGSPDGLAYFSAADLRTLAEKTGRA